MALQYRKLFNFHRWLLGGTSHSLGRSRGGGSEEKEKNIPLCETQITEEKHKM